MWLPVRLLFFAAAVCSLLAGLLGGLMRLDISRPMAMLLTHHGAFMVCGLFGTLISLERAVAMARPWPYLAPAFSMLGVLGLLLGLPSAWLPVPFIAAALVLFLASVRLVLQQKVLHLTCLAAAAGMWLVGNLWWWFSGFIMPAIPAWSAFLVLTIAGERLELSRFLPTPPLARRAFAGVLLLLLLAALLPGRSGVVLFAASLILLVLWLLRYDIVRHTLRQQGLPRYIAVCLTSAYLWLFVSAGLTLAAAAGFNAPLQDAALHALLLGFVFSMVFGHAPIVLPAVARLRLPYHALLYVPLAVLQLSLALRVGAGLTSDFALRQMAGLGNVGAIVLFALTVVGLLLRPKN